MTLTRLLLAAVAIGWLVLTLLGGARLGLDLARVDREVAIGRALEDPTVVDELRTAAIDAAFADLPEVGALARTLVDDTIAEVIASQPVTRRLVSAEVDRRLGLGHDAVTITTADVPADVRSLLEVAGIDLAVELLPAQAADGGIVATLETALLAAGVAVGLTHLAAARLFGRAVAAFAGCAGALMGLVGLGAAAVAATSIGDPIRRAIAVTAAPEDLFAVGGLLLAIVAGRAGLAHLGRLPYGALSPNRLGFTADDPDV